MDDVTRAMSKGGLVNVQEWVCFSFFGRADDVTRAMSKGGGVFVNVQEWECFTIFYKAFKKKPIMGQKGSRPQYPPPPHTHTHGSPRGFIIPP